MSSISIKSELMRILSAVQEMMDMYILKLLFIRMQETNCREDTIWTSITICH